KKKDAQILKDNKKHLQEIENLKKINSTQEEEITQLRQEITDTIYTPQIEYEMSEEEKEEYAKFFDDAVYEQVFFDDNLQKYRKRKRNAKRLHLSLIFSAERKTATNLLRLYRQTFCHKTRKSTDRKGEYGLKTS
ncbi:hypothetical protein, partial [Prevotella melaninogenica]|uniref:hypothetical protein n=1 Tax=Prevotella melaninogenica TaxID=28132 RepID=UPI001C6076CF